jgi:hypothetical protein
MLFVTENVIPPEHHVVMMVVLAVVDKLVATEFVFRKMKYVVPTALEVMEKVLEHTVVLKIPNVAREVVFLVPKNVVQVAMILILMVVPPMKNVAVLIVLKLIDIQIKR